MASAIMVPVSAPEPTHRVSGSPVGVDRVKHWQPAGLGCEVVNLAEGGG